MRRLCAGCHEPLDPLKRSDARWCSAACRERVRRAREAGWWELSCMKCWEPFVGRRHALYCSQRCRQAAYRQRRRSRAEHPAQG
jgi:hypothetical protein